MGSGMWEHSNWSDYECVRIEGETREVQEKDGCAERIFQLSCRMEKPAALAASDKRWSPQMKVRLAGRRSHQISEAASCMLSAARKGCVSNSCPANSRT